MKKVVIYDDYTVEFKDKISDEDEYNILKRATRYYSSNKLEFKRNEKYKIFTVKLNGKKQKVIVANNLQLDTGDWKKIAKRIHKNTVLYYEAQSNYNYSNIIVDKSYTNPRRAKVLFALDKITWVALTTISVINFSTLAPLLFLLIAKGAFEIIFTLVEMFDSFSNLSEYIECNPIATSFFIRIIDYPIFQISKTIKNIIGDIKNDNFSIKEKFCKIGRKFKNIFKKLSKRVNKQERINEELNKVGELLEQEEIHPKAYKLNNERMVIPPVELTDSFMSTKSEYLLVAITKINNKEMQKNYMKEYRDIMSNYTDGKIDLTDITKRQLMSNIQNLEEKVNSLLLMQNDEDKIDELLEETRVNQYVKARH